MSNHLLGTKKSITRKVELHKATKAILTNISPSKKLFVSWNGQKIGLVGRILFSNNDCFMAAVVVKLVMQSSYPVFMLIESWKDGKKLGRDFLVKFKVGSQETTLLF